MPCHQPRSRASFGILAAALALLGLACAGGGPGPRPEPAVPAPDRPFLVPPSRGYPLVVEPVALRRLDDASSELLIRGDALAAERALAELGAGDRGLHPALVLRAQVHFFRREYSAAVELLRPVVEELPDYIAAQLVVGRCAERTGDLLGALEAYEAVADGVPIAAEAARVLGRRSAEILANRIRDALDRGRTEEAKRALEQLERVAGDAPETLEVVALLADRVGDPARELEAVRTLAERSPGDQALALRRADLELEAGDVGVGLRILQEVADDRADDPRIQERLAQAKFRWRLELLPVEVQRLARLPELTRGEFAGLVFWLFPDVRYGAAGEGRIANDIFEDPFRDEIVRVVNMGLMSIDPGLHEFGPQRPMLRGDALAAFFRLLQRRRPPLACLGGHASGGLEAISTLCDLSARCGVIREAAECLAGAPVSGGEAVEMSRKSLELLEAG